MVATGWLVHCVPLFVLCLPRGAPLGCSKHSWGAIASVFSSQVLFCPCMDHRYICCLPLDNRVWLTVNERSQLPRCRHSCLVYCLTSTLRRSCFQLLYCQIENSTAEVENALTFGLTPLLQKLKNAIKDDYKVRMQLDNMPVT